MGNFGSPLLFLWLFNVSVLRDRIRRKDTAENE